MVDDELMHHSIDRTTFLTGFCSRFVDYDYYIIIVLSDPSNNRDVVESMHDPSNNRDVVESMLQSQGKLERPNSISSRR